MPTGAASSSSRAATTDQLLEPEGSSRARLRPGLGFQPRRLRARAGRPLGATRRRMRRTRHRGLPGGWPTLVHGRRARRLAADRQDVRGGQAAPRHRAGRPAPEHPDRPALRGLGGGRALERPGVEAELADGNLARARDPLPAGPLRGSPQDREGQLAARLDRRAGRGALARAEEGSRREAPQFIEGPFGKSGRRFAPTSPSCDGEEGPVRDGRERAPSLRPAGDRRPRRASRRSRST